MTFVAIWVEHHRLRVGDDTELFAVVGNPQSESACGCVRGEEVRVESRPELTMAECGGWGGVIGFVRLCSKTLETQVKRRLVHEDAHAVPREHHVLLRIDRPVLPPPVVAVVAVAAVLGEQEELVLEAAAPPPGVHVEAEVHGVGIGAGGRQL